MTDKKKFRSFSIEELLLKQLDLMSEQLRIIKEAGHEINRVSSPPQVIGRHPLDLVGKETSNQSEGVLEQTPRKVPENSHERVQNQHSIKIAVIGMAGRFPGARNISEFWKNLNNGVESITTFKPEEIDVAVPAAERLSPHYGRSRGILADADKFDAEFFRISPREAKVIDPQQRIFLEVAYEALQDAGYDPERYKGEIGVFGGVGDNFYHINNVLDKKDLIGKVGGLTTTVGNMKDYVATRVSYKLNLKGPSISINTACSTSLVAVDQAVLGLRNFTCDMALAGASTVYVPQRAGFMFGPGSPFSSDGHIRPFSGDATGVMFSDGAGIVVLKRLEDALRDRDHIYGVIIGSAINNDGTDKMSFFAPSAEGQCKVITKALKDAGISPETLSFIEAHATGTLLGDPVEFQGLKAAFAPYTQKKNFCALGAFKANVGHVDAAAGVAGLIKALLALKYKVLPPNINFTRENPEINFAESPFYIPTQTLPLKSQSGPLRAGVSAFGFGGTNAHVLIEEAPPAQISTLTKPCQLFLLSGQTEAAWKRNGLEFMRHLREHPETSLADAAYTLSEGRKSFQKRSYILAQNREECLIQLEKSLLLNPYDTVHGIPPLVFMFPGQGTQSIGMGQALYKEFSTFRKYVDYCAETLQPLISFDLRKIIFPGQHDSRQAEEMLEQTTYAQPALFTIQYALAQVFLELGLKPEALVGHSLGEFTCATLSGVIQLDEALFLVAERGRLMQQMAPGSMLSVNLSDQEARELLDHTISIAAINGPKQCVLSGPYESMDRIKKVLENRGVGCRQLKTSHGFHSPSVDAIRSEFLKAFEKVRLHPPQVPYVSTLTARWITAEEAQSPIYWFNHMRQTVRFYESIKTLWSQSPYILLELGPRETATLLARKVASDPMKYRAIPTMTGDDIYRSFIDAVGQLWTVGFNIDWKKFFEDEKRSRIPLPSYSFEKVSHWLDSIPADPLPSEVMRKDFENLNRASEETLLADEIHGKLPDAKITPNGQVSNTNIFVTHKNTEAKATGKSPENFGDALLASKELIDKVRDLFLEAAGIIIESTRENVGFLELGFDSLSLAQVSSQIKKLFSVDIPYGRLIKEQNTFKILVQYIASQTQNEVSSLGPREPKEENSRTVDEIQSFPVSFSQRRMWMHAQIAPDATTYQIPIYFSIKGSFNRELFRQSIEHTVWRHDILRSSYHLEGGEIIQKFHSNLPLSFAEMDLSSQDLAESEERLKELLNKFGKTPFQLDNPPLIRFYLFKLNSSYHVFFLNAHHIVFDLVSIKSFLTELGQTYKNLVLGKILEKVKPQVQYIDFVRWQRNWAQSKMLDTQISYWKEHLGAQPISVLKLKTDFKRPLVQPEVDSNYVFQIEKKPISPLLVFATQNGASPFTLLLAVYNIFLMRLTGTRSVIIGTPIASRSQPETKDTIGFFANTLALRSFAQEGQSFKDFLLQIRDDVFSAFEHQDAPIDEVIRQLPIDRNPQYNGLFQTFVSFEKVRSETYNMGDISMVFMGDVARAAPATDLNIWIEDHDEHFLFTVEYSMKLFKIETVGAMCDQLAGMLKNLALNPNQNIESLLTIASYPHEIEKGGSQKQVATKEQDFPQIQENLAQFGMIVEEILGIRKLDWNESFQYQGGHSLLGVRLIEKIKAHYGIDLNLRDVLRAPTVRAIWQNIQSCHDDLIKQKPAPEASQLLSLEGVPLQMSLHQLLSLSCAQHGGKTAIRYRKKSLTFHELELRSNQVARYLQAAGVTSGSIVGIAMDRSIDLIVGMVGILKAGGAYLPMDPAYPNDRLVYMAENSGLKLILSEEEYVETLNMPKSVRLIAMDSDARLISQQSDGPLHTNLNADGLAYVIYTSGSTGKPKGVQIPHRSVVTFIHSMRKALAFSEHEVLMALTTICFDISILEIFLTLSSGATLILMDSESALDGKKLAQTIEEQKVTVFQATPSGWRILIESGWKGSPEMMGLCGGEAFPKDLAAKLIPLVKTLFNVYGPTEATVWATYHLIRKPEDHKFIGKPLENYRIFILDDKMQTVPSGEIGDLYIGGQALALGYLNRPDLTAERFISSPFHPGERIYQTGDRARFTYDGLIEYISRADDQVKIRGYRIELGEIESVANMFPPVKLSAAIVHEYAPGDQRIVLFISPRERMALNEAELKDFMRKSLPDYFIPNVIKSVETIPLTQNGKIDKKVLKASCIAETNERGTEKKSRRSTEELVEHLWKLHLKVTQISKNMNFFQQGGYSLLAIIVAKEISQATGHPVNLADLLTLTFQQLVYRIDQDVHRSEGRVS